MWKPLLRCSIVGGVLVFLWLTLSWTVLPFHKMTFQRFTDEVETESTILSAAPKDGIYVIPYMDQKGEAQTGASKVHPFIFANIKRGVNFSSMTKSIAFGMFTQVLGALFITYFLLKAKIRRYWGRVYFVTLVGFTVAILSALPAWNWWHFPCSWIMMSFVDYIVGWFLGGLVIAKLVKD